MVGRFLLGGHRLDQPPVGAHEAEVKAADTTVTRIFGIGPLDAAMIIGDVGDVTRFPTRDHFASYTGATRSSAPGLRTPRMGTLAT